MGLIARTRFWATSEQCKRIIPRRKDGAFRGTRTLHGQSAPKCSNDIFGQSIKGFVFCDERPDTWVTVCTGHIGDTSSPRGGNDALDGVFGYG